MTPWRRIDDRLSGPRSCAIGAPKDVRGLAMARLSSGSHLLVGHGGGAMLDPYVSPHGGGGSGW